MAAVAALLPHQEEWPRPACETATERLHTQTKGTSRSQQLLAGSEHDISEQAFRFFDLSPELRNLIYSHTSVAVTERSYHKHLRWAASPFCSANARLISHQFKSEYEDEIFHHAKLYVAVGTSRSDTSFFMPPIPDWSYPVLRRLTLDFRSKFYYWEQMEFQRKLNILRPFIVHCRRD